MYVIPKPFQWINIDNDDEEYMDKKTKKEK
jgi:hypothetical protein